MTNLIVYAHGRSPCSNWVRHGSTIISYLQCSLAFLCERCLHRCREQSFAIRAYTMSAVGKDVVSVVVVVVLLFYVLGKHLMSCRDGQLT